MDEQQEKELNILMNNPNAQGTWDFDALARIVPDIDWKDAGLTDADLNMIGVDYLLQTEGENSIADALSDMMTPVSEQKEADKAAKQLERAEKVAHMKEVKQQVKENAQKQAENMDAYVMLSFDTYEAKAAFCERFGYGPDMKFIKGEVFDEQIERIDWYVIAPAEFTEVVDTIDNLLGAMKIPMPAEFHVKQMKHELKEVSDRLKRIYVEEEDENPWSE